MRHLFPSAIGLLVAGAPEQNITLSYSPSGCAQNTCNTNITDIDDAIICASKVQARRDCRALLRWDYMLGKGDQACPWQDLRELFCLPGLLPVGNLMLDYVEAIAPETKPECVPSFNLTVVEPAPKLSGTEELCVDNYYLYPQIAIKSTVHPADAEGRERALRFVLPEETPLRRCYRIGYALGTKECTVFGKTHNNTEAMIIHAYRFFGSDALSPIASIADVDYKATALPTFPELDSSSTTTDSSAV